LTVEAGEVHLADVQGLRTVEGFRTYVTRKFIFLEDEDINRGCRHYAAYLERIQRGPTLLDLIDERKPEENDNILLELLDTIYRMNEAKRDELIRND